AQKKAPWPLPAPPTSGEADQSGTSPPAGQPGRSEGEQATRVISHVLLYKSQPNEITTDPEKEKYEEIASSNLDKLLSGVASPSTTKKDEGSGQPAGMAGGSSPPGGAMGGATGGPGGGGAKGTSWKPLTDEQIAPPPSDSKDKDKNQSTGFTYKRTEFVVVF